MTEENSDSAARLQDWTRRDRWSVSAYVNFTLIFSAGGIVGTDSALIWWNKDAVLQAKKTSIEHLSKSDTMEYCREGPKLEVEAQAGKWPDGGNPQPSIDDEAKEKRLIRKIDANVLPFVVLLYLFSFLDRGMLYYNAALVLI